MSVLSAKVKFFARENCNLSAAARFDKLDPPDNEQDVPNIQRCQTARPGVARSQVDLNTPSHPGFHRHTPSSKGDIR